MESSNQPKRENDHLKNKPHIQHLPFFCPYYKGGNHCIARMSPPYVAPQPSNCGENFRVQPAGRGSADQSQSTRPAAAAGPPCRRHRPDHFHWRLWRTGSGYCCTFAKDTPCAAVAAGQGSGSSRPVPFYGYRHSGCGCPCPASFHKCGSSRLLWFSG